MLHVGLSEHLYVIDVICNLTANFCLVRIYIIRFGCLGVVYSMTKMNFRGLKCAIVDYFPWEAGVTGEGAKGAVGSRVTRGGATGAVGGLWGPEEGLHKPSGGVGAERGATQAVRGWWTDVYLVSIGNGKLTVYTLQNMLSMSTVWNIFIQLYNI